MMIPNDLTIEQVESKLQEMERFVRARFDLEVQLVFALKQSMWIRDYFRRYSTTRESQPSDLDKNQVGTKPTERIVEKPKPIVVFPKHD